MHFCSSTTSACARTHSAQGPGLRPHAQLHTLHIYEKDRGGSPLPRAVVIQEEEERSSREVNLDAVPGDASPMEITGELHSGLSAQPTARAGPMPIVDTATVPFAGRSATSRRRSFMLTSPPRPADHDAATSSPPNATVTGVLRAALPRRPASAPPSPRPSWTSNLQRKRSYWASSPQIFRLRRL